MDKKKDYPIKKESDAPKQPVAPKTPQTPAPAKKTRAEKPDSY
jgi:hypothetical protein